MVFHKFGVYERISLKGSHPSPTNKREMETGHKFGS